MVGASWQLCFFSLYTMQIRHSLETYITVQHSDENSYFNKHGPAVQDGVYGDTWEKNAEQP